MNAAIFTDKRRNYGDRRFAAVSIHRLFYLVAALLFILTPGLKQTTRAAASFRHRGHGLALLGLHPHGGLQPPNAADVAVHAPRNGHRRRYRHVEGPTAEMTGMPQLDRPPALLRGHGRRHRVTTHSRKRRQQLPDDAAARRCGTYRFLPFGAKWLPAVFVALLHRVDRRLPQALRQDISGAPAPGRNWMKFWERFIAFDSSHVWSVKSGPHGSPR